MDEKELSLLLEKLLEESYHLPSEELEQIWKNIQERLKDGTLSAAKQEQN